MGKHKKTRPTSPEDIKQFEPPQESYVIDSPSKRCRATLAALRKGPGGATDYKVATGAECFNTTCTKRHAERAVWLWSQLETALGKRGIVIESGEVTKIVGHGADREILLRETSSHYHERQKDYWGRDRDYERQRHFPNGYFKFDLGYVWELEQQKSWGDTNATALDSRVEEIAGFFDVALPQIRDSRAKRDQENKEFEERQQAARNAREAARIEGEKRTALVSLATNFRSAELIRELLSGIREEAGQDLPPRLTEWLDWAEIAANEINPVARIIQMLADGQDPCAPTPSVRSVR